MQLRCKAGASAPSPLKSQSFVAPKRSLGFWHRLGQANVDLLQEANDGLTMSCLLQISMAAFLLQKAAIHRSGTSSLGASLQPVESVGAQTQQLAKPLLTNRSSKKSQRASVIRKVHQLLVTVPPEQANHLAPGQLILWLLHLALPCYTAGAPFREAIFCLIWKLYFQGPVACTESEAGPGEEWRSRKANAWKPMKRKGKCH